ncbi:MAG: tetratricopeptide repeat protein [Candidatus Omnitrophica bacterium]|nr:tetratricopeptide repeat protein [Candidatus Omnitrophota bacterium]MDD5429838.1 tetratricopeptide repeat protein [Candidatus Omnitrophota bacterium]
MRIFLIAIILCASPFLSFAKNQKSVTQLYSNYLKGLAYVERKDYPAGLRALEEARAEDPDSIHIRLKIATVLINMRRFDEAEKILLEVKEIDPNNLDVSLVLIFVYSYAQKDKELEEEYEFFLEKAHESKPKDIGISEYLAQFYFYKKKPQQAIEVYKKIIETNPKHVTAYFWLGYLYEEAGRRREAVDMWKAGLEIDGSYAPILNSLGYVYAQEGNNLDLAEEMVQKALKEEPENGAYLDSLGWIYYRKGDFDKAKEYLEKSITYIKDPEVYEHLGDLYITTGEKDKGLEFYGQGLENFPDYKRLQEKIDNYEKQGKSLKE